MDSFTTEGVPWFLPIPVKLGLPPFKSMRIKTGGIIETFIVFPGLMIATIIVIYTHYDKLQVFLHNYLK
jgi:hypothetical protein